MLYFYSTSEFFNNQCFDKNFVNAFNSLTKFAKALVLKNNLPFNEFAKTLIDSSYPDIDFSKKNIRIAQLIIRNMEITTDICPIHTLPLIKKTVSLKAQRKNKKIILDTCSLCRAFYLSQDKKELEELKKSHIDFRIVTLEIK